MSSAQPPRLDWKADDKLITGRLLWFMLATGLMLMPGLMLNTCIYHGTTIGSLFDQDCIVLYAG
jgi:hypothetical protein